MLGKFSALIEAKCSKVDAEFLVVESETSPQGYTTATEFISGGKRIRAVS